MHERHYCHNCGYFSELRDGTYCHYCLTFFYGNGRLPRKSDTVQAQTAIETLWASIDAMGK